MNTLTSITIADPTHKESNCAQLVIDNLDDPFTMYGVTTDGQEYTLSFSIRSGLETDPDTLPTISIGETVFDISTEWNTYDCTFTADTADLALCFDTAGTYYIYHLQLEQGNMPTDWSPAPEDAEEAARNAQTTADGAKDSADNAAKQVVEAKSAIEMLKDQIRMMVTDENGQTMMTQDGDGWTFDFMHHIGSVQSAFDEAVSELEERYGNTESVVDALRSQFSDMNNYVKISEYDDGVNTKPCIELGGNTYQEGTSNFFRLLITNTSVVFFDDTTKGTEIDNDGVTTDSLTLRSELRQSNPIAVPGSGVYVWAMRQNGNYGLTWKGATS